MALDQERLMRQEMQQQMVETTPSPPGIKYTQKIGQVPDLLNSKNLKDYRIETRVLQCHLCHQFIGGVDKTNPNGMSTSSHFDPTHRRCEDRPESKHLCEKAEKITLFWHESVSKATFFSKRDLLKEMEVYASNPAAGAAFLDALVIGGHCLEGIHRPEFEKFRAFMRYY